MRTALGKRLVELREAAIAKGMELLPDECDERKEFEEWYSEAQGPGINVIREKHGYAATSAQFMWRGWQARASRERK